MANWLTRKISKLDWWDKEENARQQQQFDRESEEERRRKQAEAAKSSVQNSNPRPGSVIQPNQPLIPDVKEPLIKIGSQSNFNKNPADPLGILGIPGVETPLQKMQKEAAAKPKVPEAPKAPLPDQEFIGLDNGEKKNKTIFGMNAAAFLPKSLEKVTQVKVGRKFTTNKDKYVAQFDTLDDERKKMLVNETRKKAEAGDPAAVNTMKALQETGRLKGDFMDFVEGSNDKLYGGITRAGARTVELLPGDQGTGKWADKDAEANAAYTDTGKMGEKFGSVQKGIVDIATIVLPASKIDKLAEGTKVVKALNDGSKIMKIGGKLVKVVPGSIAGSGIDALQTIGRGDDVDVAKSTGVGLGLDLAVEAAGGPLGKGTSKVMKMLRRGKGDQLIDDAAEAVIGTTTASATGGKRALDDFAEQTVKDGKLETALEKVTKEEANAVPGVVEKEIDAAAPAVEVAPGVKSTNAAKPEAQAAAQAAEDAKVVAPVAEVVDDGVGTVPKPAINIPSPSTVVPEKMPVGAVAPNDVPIANFNDAIDAPLEKIAPPPAQVIDEVPVAAPTPTDLAQAAAKGDLPIETPTTAQGNAGLVSDAKAAQQLEEAGIAPARSNSVAATTEEQLAREADEAARAQVNLDGAAAPNTRTQVSGRIEDPSLQAEVLENYPQAGKINIAEEQALARDAIGSASDDELVQAFANGVDVSTPQGYYRAVYLVDRLGRTDVLENIPGANDVVQQAVNAITDRASEGGKILRTTQMLFENMPPAMKTQTLIKQLNKAGVDLADTDRAELLRLMEQSDNSVAATRKVTDEITAIRESMKNNPGGQDVDALARRYGELEALLADAKNVAGVDTAKMVRFYDSFRPPGSVGGQAADIGRGLMLSGMGGRVFDNISTAGTLFNDVVSSNVSALAGKVINKVRGGNDVVEKFVAPGQLTKGFKRGMSDIRDSFRGLEKVDGAGQSLLQKQTSRSGIENKGNRFTRFINNVVDIPTKLTQGMEGAKIAQLADQEAAELGLDGAERELYAQFRTLDPTDAMKHDAVQAHMKVNNLHENGVTDLLNRVVNSLSGKKFGANKQLEGAVDVLVKNQAAPFTSFLGGNFHRAITDKNMLYNVIKGANDLRKGDLQGFADQLGNLGTNTVQAIAGGYTLSKMGLLSETDANGDSYGGLYLHLGDRYIPVSILGVGSVPLIFGHAVESGEDFNDIAGKAVSNTFASAGIASVFGGENSLQQTFGTLAKGNDNLTDPVTKYFGGLTRQYANPGIFGDINAGLNNDLPFGINPNAEGLAPQVDATKINPETGREIKDVQKTEINRTLAGIPGISQGMERNPDKQAPDLLDRGLKSTRESGEMAEARTTKETLDAEEKQLRTEKIDTKEDAVNKYKEDGDYDKAIRAQEFLIKKTDADPNASAKDKERVRDNLVQTQLAKDGVSVKDEGINARIENGNYSAAIKGKEYQLKKVEDDDDVPASKKEELRNDIKRLQITDEGGYEPSIIKLYSDISATEWRKMADPESEEYDPETVALLEEYDGKLAAAGVSKGKKPSALKYTDKSGSGGKKARFITDIATNRFSEGGFTPQKIQGASMATPGSSIPTLEKVANYSQKPKKISVSRGGRA